MISDFIFSYIFKINFREVKMSLPIITKTTTTSYRIDSWEVLKSKVKEKFPYLTDNDLDYEEGKVEAFVDNLSTKIGKIIEKTKNGLHEFINSL
jgi:uncharacterized protein YjbJ (UPF0337 family)